MRALVEARQDAMMKLSAVYLQQHPVDVDFAELWQRVMLTNQRLVKERGSPVTVVDVVSPKEMGVLAGLHRWVGDELARQRLAGNSLVQALETEAVDLGGVPGEWQRPSGVPGGSDVPGVPDDQEAEHVVLYFHGGGMITGSIADHRGLTAAIGDAARAPVLSVDYRLAPEYPFPAQVDDCLAAYTWLVDHGTPAEKVVIAGDSAGGMLTLATLLNLKARDLPLPGGAVCLSPATDYAEAPDSFYANAITDPILADAGLFWWILAYLGPEDPADPTDPLVSPLRGDLAGLPPLLIQASACEMLRDQSTRFVAKAEAADVPVTYQEWPDMIHVWQDFGWGVLPEAADAVAKIGAFIRQL